MSPSEAYREATGSLVYRLSELMFGSLLAAYSLGFVGAIAARGSQVSAHGRLGIGLLALQYLCISISFAYLTTSLYLTYHVGILTMPQLPFDRLGRDFSIAFFQAVFFGLSMLLPALFPILLSLNFLVSGWRKNDEYRGLAFRLFKKNGPEKSRDDSDDILIFREELAKLLQGKRQLKVWAPIGPDIRRYGLLALKIGLAVISICLALEYGEMALQNSQCIPRLKDKWVLQQLLISIELVAATIIIMGYGSRVLRRRASFIGFPVKNPGFRIEQPETKVTDGSDAHANPQTEKRPLIDREFDDLQAELKELCERLFPKS